MNYRNNAFVQNVIHGFKNSICLIWVPFIELDNNVGFMGIVSSSKTHCGIAMGEWENWMGL